MASGVVADNYRWLPTGTEVFPAMLRAIDQARESVRLEMYIFSPGDPGDSFRDTLVCARQRGVSVRVMVDGLGSMQLPSGYWQGLQSLGGEVRIFNPVSLNRLGIRNHRKLIVCDDRLAFVGGYNIAPEYEGDGVTRGWCDLGMHLEGPLVSELALSFDELFSRADFLHKRFVRLRKAAIRRARLLPQALSEARFNKGNEPRSADEQVLLSGPGLGFNPIKSALRRDLGGARDVQIMSAYFLPTWRLRRDLLAVVRHGGQVKLLLPGKSDVALAKLAGRSLYRRLLHAGVEIHEYLPQVLHGKMIIIDDVVYLGSANLDHRSLNINYELMIRLANPEIAARARAFYAQRLERCRHINAEQWNRSRTIWRRLEQRWAYFVLARLDPYLANRQWRALPD
jgi:cardiolipin synthase